MAGEYDLELVAGDLAFGPDSEPRFLAGADAIAQDVKHRLLESGLVPALVADEGDPEPTLAAICFAVEEDLRLRPGSAKAEVAEAGAVSITARTLDGAPVGETVHTQG